MHTNYITLVVQVSTSLLVTFRDNENEILLVLIIHDTGQHGSFAYFKKESNPRTSEDIVKQKTPSRSF